jgi:hypothetical protein
MLVLLSLMACSGDEGAGPEAAPPPGQVTPPPPTDGPLPEPRLGVSEVVTPPEVVRPTEVQDRAAPALLDVWFAPDVTTFDALGTRLESWGFTLLDGDGESWRVGAPPGVDWPARLVALPAVAKVTEAVDLVPFETGAFREGSERYGAGVHTWAWREGGPVETFTGGPTPPEPVFPHALPAPVVRCLAPARTEITSGVSVGIGWERALVARPSSWVLVLEDYGACKASGYVALRADAPIDTLRVGGRPVAELDAPTIHSLAIEYLRRPRTYEDPSGIAAWDLLRSAPDDTLTRALGAIAPGPFQKKLWQELDQRDHTAALAVATGSSSATLASGVTAETDSLRARALTDPKAPWEMQYAALSVWRPGPTDPPETLAHLRESPAPRVREKAWEITLDATMAPCTERAKSLATAAVPAASAIFRECPQQPVRSPAFQRVAALDKVAAGAMLRVVLEDPETVRTGIAAVRQAEALERDDLLDALVRRPTVARDVRRVALEYLVKEGNANAAELIEQHGAYLGYKPLPGAAAVPAAAGVGAVSDNPP